MYEFFGKHPIWSSFHESRTLSLSPTCLAKIRVDIDSPDFLPQVEGDLDLSQYFAINRGKLILSSIFLEAFGPKALLTPWLARYQKVMGLILATCYLSSWEPAILKLFMVSAFRKAIQLEEKTMTLAAWGNIKVKKEHPSGKEFIGWISFWPLVEFQNSFRLSCVLRIRKKLSLVGLDLSWLTESAIKPNSLLFQLVRWPHPRLFGSLQNQHNHQRVRGRWGWLFILVVLSIESPRWSPKWF